MKKLGFVLIMVLTAFFLMGCPNPVREVEEETFPTEEEVLEMYKDWYISKSNEQANLRSMKNKSTEYTVDDFMKVLSNFSVNVKNCHLKYAKDENSLELWLENDELKAHLILILEDKLDYIGSFSVDNNSGNVADTDGELGSIEELVDYINSPNL